MHISRVFDFSRDARKMDPFLARKCEKCEKRFYPKIGSCFKIYCFRKLSTKWNCILLIQNQIGWLFNHLKWNSRHLPWKITIYKPEFGPKIAKICPKLVIFSRNFSQGHFSREMSCKTISRSREKCEKCACLFTT